MRTTCDANLLVRAALHPQGLARAIVDLATHPRHTLVLSPQLVGDVRRVLRYDRIRKKYGITDAEIDEYGDLLLAAAEVVLRPVIVPVVLADPDDDIVVATAVDGKAEVIGTRDQHFAASAVVSYCEARGIRILDDVQLVRELRAALP